MTTRRAVVCLVFLVLLSMPAVSAQAGEEPRAAIPWIPENLDPTMNLSSIRAQVGVSLFDSLVARDRDGKIVPELAESWKLLNDTTWQFKLRLGLPMQQVDLYATRDPLEWTPRPDQWLLFHEAMLK